MAKKEKQIFMMLNLAANRTFEIIAWDAFLHSIKNKHQNCNYSLRPHPNPKI